MQKKNVSLKWGYLQTQRVQIGLKFLLLSSINSFLLLIVI